MSSKLLPQILLYEPEEPSNIQIKTSLERTLFDVTCVNGQNNIFDTIKIRQINIAIISLAGNVEDINNSAYKVKELLHLKKIPIIFIVDSEITKKGLQNLEDKITIFTVKPVKTDQIIKKIRSLFRQYPPVCQSKIISYKDIKLNLSTYEVFNNKQLIHLTPVEFAILQTLVQHPSRIFSREELLKILGNENNRSSKRSIDVHINKIRTTLRSTNNQEKFIKTVRAKGYCLI